MKYLKLIISWEQGSASANTSGFVELACSYITYPSEIQLAELADSIQKFDERYVTGFSAEEITEQEFEQLKKWDVHKFD